MKRQILTILIRIRPDGQQLLSKRLNDSLRPTLSRGSIIQPIFSAFDNLTGLRPQVQMTLKTLPRHKYTDMLTFKVITTSYLDIVRRLNPIKFGLQVCPKPAEFGLDNLLSSQYVPRSFPCAEARCCEAVL